jgi:23S rRNA (guanosine2251-2'-O)-methyltransferase
MKLNSHQLRKSKIKEGINHQKKSTKNPIVLVLDNVLDTYNIGSFFRLGDALNVEKICLCGQVVTPPNIKIHRASIGTWKWVSWEHYPNTIDCLEKLKEEGYQINACEQVKGSVNYKEAKYKFPIAIIAGSENFGISKEVLALCDQIVEIPMYGVNISLNVLIATSIIAYQAFSDSK